MEGIADDLLQIESYADRLDNPEERRRRCRAVSAPLSVLRSVMVMESLTAVLGF